MSKNVLVVVDMQNDFIDGALGTDEAKTIVDNVCAKIKSFDGEVIFTRDTHFDNYNETQEGRNLPVPHCIKGTSGWELNGQVAELLPGGAKIFDKPTFGSVDLAEYLRQNKELQKVTLVGLCTDICIISNAMVIKANMPEVVVEVDESCCAGVTPQSHRNAIEAMKMCQIEII